MPLLPQHPSRVSFLFPVFHPSNRKPSTKLAPAAAAPLAVAMRASFNSTPAYSSAATTPPNSQEEYNRNQAELYHQQTKHHLHKYARGPRGLDWANQPNPFLRYVSAPLLPLLHLPPRPGDCPTYATLFSSPTLPLPPQRLDLSSLSRLLYDSLSLSAWKSTGYSTWSLRVNPSSGNLHPTEAYVIAPPLPTSLDGDADTASAFFSSPFIAHYAPKEHALELRSSVPSDIFQGILPQGSSFLLGFSSIFWREAWKYGERAFRYCNHDVGHAIAAVTIAAAALGWDVKLLDGLGHSDIRNLFGIGLGFPAPESEVPSCPASGRFTWMELEHPDCALAVFPPTATSLEGIAVNYAQMSSEVARLKSLQWFGKPNSLSKSHVCWDVIYRTAAAVEKPLVNTERISISPLQSGGLLSEGIYKEYTAREVVRKRRSAVDMDGLHVMKQQTFYQILMHCLPSGYPDTGKKQGKQSALPFRVLPWDSEVHTVLFVHRVDGLPNGIYFMVRNEDHFDSLKRAMRPDFKWEKPDGCPVGLPLYQLLNGDCEELSKQLSCHQDIASDGCFSLGMVARFSPVLREKGAWMYPRLFWEAGVLGQVLYLEAHAVGISATGIGCYFDDSVHKILGLGGTEFQSLYHFTVGNPVVDKRIMSLPAYPGPKVDA